MCLRLFVCLSVCLSVCLPCWLPAPACLPTLSCLSGWLSVCPPFCFSNTLSLSPLSLSLSFSSRLFSSLVAVFALRPGAYTDFYVIDQRMLGWGGVAVSVCRPVCLSVCLSVLSVCLSLPACLPACLPLPACLAGCVSVRLLFLYLSLSPFLLVSSLRSSPFSRCAQVPTSTSMSSTSGCLAGAGWPFRFVGLFVCPCVSPSLRPVCLFVCLFVCLSVCLSVCVWGGVAVSVCRSVCLFFLCLSLFVCVCVCACLFIVCMGWVYPGVRYVLTSIKHVRADVSLI